MSATIHPLRSEDGSIVTMLGLLNQMFRLIKFSSLLTPFKLPEKLSKMPYYFAACQFYQVSDPPSPPEQCLERPQYTTIFENLIALTQTLAHDLQSSEAKTKNSTSKAHMQAMLLLCDLVHAIESSHLAPLQFSWIP